MGGEFGGVIAIMVILGLLLPYMAVYFYIGKKRDQYIDKKIQENPRKYLADGLGNGLLGNLYRGACRMDDSIERATRPPEEFYGLVHCPACKTYAFHHIYKYTKRHVIRQCVCHECGKKWKQIR